MHNYIYDPEGNANASLTPGQRYQGTPVPATRHADLRTPAVRVDLGDLIVPRSKPVEKLYRAVPHIAHEARMLVACYLQRAYAPAYTAWFVHARNLMDFFEGKGHEPDEICAQLYFPGREHHWHSERRKVRPPARYRKYRAAANKLAAHLTFDRIKYERRRFPPDRRVTEHLLGYVTLFASELDAKSRRRFVSQLLPADR